MIDASPRSGRPDGLLLLGIDGGGTGCRARLCDEASGRVLGEGRGGPANLRFGVEAAYRAVLDAANGSLAAAGLPVGRLGAATACIGFAGGSEPGLIDAARAHPHPFRDVVITSDAHVACVGAHAGGDGGVIVVGTGTIAWAASGARHHRFGGWGIPISDEGSGAWLGLEAVRRTLWAHDGRLAWTPLLERVFARFGSDPHRIVTWMTGAKPRDFGTVAPLVVEHAATGDPVGAELMNAAAAHLDALAARLNAVGASRIALVGGLSPFVTERLSEETRRRLVAPEGDAVDGALHLARAETVAAT